MENFIFSLNVILPLFMMMAVGFVVRRTKLGSATLFDGMNALSFRLLLPVMLFCNIVDMQGTDYSFDWKLIGISIGCIVAIALVLMFFVPRIVHDRKKIGVIIQGVFRSNFVLFGVPVVKNMFGDAGLWATSMLIPLVVPVFNIFAVIVLSIYQNEGHDWKAYKKTLMGIVTNPLIISIVIGYIFLFFNIPIPSSIYTGIKDIGKCATPIALMALGGKIEFRSIGSNLKYLIPTVLGRLVGCGLIIMPIAIACGYRNEALGSLLALSSSPVAISSYVMSVQTGNDGDLAAQVVAFSTIGSVFTMFLWIFVLRSIGMI